MSAWSTWLPSSPFEWQFRAPAAGVDAVGGFDERFPLYGEELDIATRLRGRGWTVRYTPAIEIVHEVGVSTGRSSRTW